MSDELELRFIQSLEQFRTPLVGDFSYVLWQFILLGIWIILGCFLVSGQLFRYLAIFSISRFIKMMLYLIAVAVCLSIGLYLYLPTKTTTFTREGYCAFCNSEVMNRQKFYEDDLVVALYTYKPILPGHCLIVPKRHVERFEMLHEDEFRQAGKVIKQVNQAVVEVFQTASYLLAQKNGVESGQTVPHVHFHYIPRAAGDSSKCKFLFKTFIKSIKKPISPIELEKNVQKLREAMAAQKIIIQESKVATSR